MRCHMRRFKMCQHQHELAFYKVTTLESTTVILFMVLLLGGREFFFRCRKASMVQFLQDKKS